MTVFDEWLDFLPSLLTGLGVSLRLTGLCMLLGLPGGLILAIGVSSPVRGIRYVGLCLVEFGRGLPALVLLQFVYFGLPQTHVILSPWVSAILALSWVTAAYTSEAFRGAINSVPRGQSEAASATGMGKWDSFRFVIGPQAARLVLPSLMGFTILIFQTTSLAFTVTVSELTNEAYTIGSQTFRYLSVLVLAGVIYAVIAAPAAHFVRRYEKKVSKPFA